MLQIRKSDARGLTRFDWLEGHHSFSFGRYYDPEHLGFGSLKVINEDHVSPMRGFGTHPHDNMEILTYVISGVLEHKDSMGNGSLIHPGEVQKMTAGTGITHSETNPDQTKKVHLLQIWIEPSVRDLPPSYSQKNFTALRAPNQMTLLASPDGKRGSILVHQDMEMSVLDLIKGTYRQELDPQRLYWVQVVKGSVTVNQNRLEAGDGVGVQKDSSIEFVAEECEALFFSLGA